MRRKPRYLEGCKENRYDQVTNLGIDLEGSLNRSIVLPKIYNKIAEIEASEYVRQKRAREERDMGELKGEIMRLRRQICLLEDRKLIQRMKTEDYDQVPPDILHRPKQSYHVASTINLRNSVEANPDPRCQRNTDKHCLGRQNNSNSFLMDNSQIQFTNSIIKLEDKPPKEVSKEKNTTLHLKTRPQQPKKEEEEPRSSGSLNKAKAKAKSKPNARLRRKFRVAVYTVYFSLFIAAFAKRNYSNRLKLIMKQYPHEVSKYSINKEKKNTVNAKTPTNTPKAESRYKVDEAKLWTYFEERLNVVELVEKGKLAACLTNDKSVRLIKEHFEFLIQNEIHSSDKEFQGEITLEQQLMYPRNIEFLLNGFQAIIPKVMDSFSSFITKADFFEHRWKTFTLGVMNNSFVHNSFPKLPAKVIESGIVRLHPFKEVLLVFDQETESMLLAFDLLCRLFIFKWLVKLEKGKAKSEQPQPQRLISTLMLSLFYLVFEKTLDDHLGEFRKAHQPSLSVGIRNKFIRPVVPLFVSSSRRRDEKLLAANQQLIVNPPFQQECMDILANNPSFVLTLQAKIKSVGFLLYERLRGKMRQEFVSMKEQTLNEHFFSGSSKRVKRSNGEIEMQEQEQQ